MRKRILYSAGTVLLALLVALVVWQSSFSFGQFEPSSPEQTLVLWGVSTLIFILTVTLGFMLARNFVKLWVERHSNREGSRIRTRLVAGALVLTFTPVVFLVFFSWGVLNRNLEKWFMHPAEKIRWDLIATGIAIDRESGEKAAVLATWISSLPEAGRARSGDATAEGSLARICDDRGISEVRVAGMVLCRGKAMERRTVEVQEADVVLKAFLPHDLSDTHNNIQNWLARYDKLAEEKRNVRTFYMLLLTLIALFILFVATWLALFLAKQISVPISALLGAAQQVRAGNLSTRVDVKAIDELASLVRAFNEMTEGLESNSRELEQRRRFTEAILESIPTGVISVASDGSIQAINRALKGLLPADQVDRASALRDLFPADDLAEIRYLMNRARRMGVAASQLELRREGKVLQVSVTVAALEDKRKPGFVLVLEDTGDLLRAQKAAAWHEVARRIAHEIRNPLTPIALCAERIIRQLDRSSGPDVNRIVRECSGIILSEVETLRTLVEEFSQFARFPSAQPAPSDLNEVVENALSVFAGRLEGIDLIRDLTPALPPVHIDREQFKRLVVNLVDNAAEAMHGSLVKRLYVGTSIAGPDMVELTLADTGCGITAEDKERLFLPYFTTKRRGTGLGLAIVNQIVSEHGANIRVEDNRPAGVRFIIELAALGVPVQEPVAMEAPA